MTQLNFTTPVGRLVQGSLYKANDKDANGAPLLVKSGPNAGKPTVKFFFAVAVPKQGEQHWAQTEWGAKIWAKGHEGFPSAGQNPKFAWKITDGDSQIPDAKNKRPCDREGFPGHWVIRFSSGFAPRIVKNENGAYVNLDVAQFGEMVKLGYYVQVNANTEFNGSTQQPGIHMNHSIVCFSGYGTEIVVGPDAASAGFGQSPAPAGMSTVPPAGAMPMPGVPGVPGAAPAPLVPGVPAPGAAFPAIPGAVAPVAAPAQPVKTMTAKANGATLEQFTAQGWTEQQLVEQGYLVITQPQPAAPPVPSVPAPLVPVGSVPTPSPVAPTVVAPNPAILQVPVGAPPVPGVPAQPVAPRYVMTAAANGSPREAFIAQGWTDAQLVQNGYMQLAA